MEYVYNDSNIMKHGYMYLDIAYNEAVKILLNL